MVDVTNLRWEITIIDATTPTLEGVPMEVNYMHRYVIST